VSIKKMIEASQRMLKDKQSRRLWSNEPGYEETSRIKNKDSSKCVSRSG
jgi:hypothetical protein